MNPFVLLSVLVPAALVAGYFIGRKENLTVLAASMQVAEHTRFVVEAANVKSDSTQALKDVAQRLDDHARGINELGLLQREAIDFSRQVLGIGSSPPQGAARRIDPDAQQVGE